MTDDIANGAVVLVGCRSRLREYVAGVEDIETLVLHSTHVEVFHRNNVVLVQIVFAAVHFFVPDHRVAKRAQGEITLGYIPCAGVNPEGHLAARRRSEVILDKLKRTRHDSKEITRLGVRVLPDGIVVAPVLAGFDLITVG